VIGIGNANRGDDAVGLEVAQHLRGTLPEDVEIAEQDGEAIALLQRFQGAEQTYLVDACASGAPAGIVRRYDVGVTPLPQEMFGVSTHGFGLAQAVELARALGDLPPRCVVYAIEGASFATGASLSPAVADAVIDVADRLYAEITEPETTKV
jgi:hydrogenase maturation protease